jgi:hypothetical protein
MSPEQMLALVAAAVAAGALNSVAGGGSFLTFPALLFAGVSPIRANATNTVALWPGSIASVGGYREDLVRERQTLLVLGSISLVGGLVGSLLLLGTPEQTFSAMIPWLLLGATLIFALGPRITKRWHGAAWVDRPPAKRLAAIGVLQFVIAVYGGYFGGGIGILMLAALSLLGMTEIHRMNALKVVLAVLINGISVVAFAIAGVVEMPVGLAMAGGAVIGGYGGARAAKRVAPERVRSFVVAWGFALSVLFFARQQGLLPF